jgi:RecA-family ATPase
MIAALIARVAEFKAKAGQGGSKKPSGHAGAGGGKDDEAEAARRAYAQTFYGRINARAFANLEAWVPELFPTAVYQPGTKAYRVSSADLGRPELEEDLSISPQGAVDFGVHDMGDERQGKRSAIDLVLEYVESIDNDTTAAALWLAERLGIDEDELKAMGYHGGGGPNNAAPPGVVCPTIFQGRTPPPRRWIVPQWIPYEVVTGFYGDGGVGKSLLAQQLQTATALGSAWIGLSVEQVTSLGAYCEDDQNELWRRQCAINASTFVDHDALGAMHWMPRLGEDNLLMTFRRSGVGELTSFHQQLVEAALDLKARLVIIDTAADVFGGNENDRNHVRQFVQRALGGIALKIDGAVVCCAHPSRAGLSSGEGDSGSTGWSNAFRSRLYIRHIEDDPNGRILERKKANYASRNDELRLRWHNGVIIRDEIGAPGVTATGGKVDAKAVFLALVREMDEQNRPVSSNSRAGNYAPREFEEAPPEQRCGFRESDFRNAMEALLRERKIKNVDYGRKGDRRTRIAVCDVVEPQNADDPV